MNFCIFLLWYIHFLYCKRIEIYCNALEINYYYYYHYCIFKRILLKLIQEHLTEYTKLKLISPKFIKLHEIYNKIEYLYAKPCNQFNQSINLNLLINLRNILDIFSSQSTRNGISKHQDFNIFWGKMPLEPPSHWPLWCLFVYFVYFFSSIYLFYKPFILYYKIWRWRCYL